MRTRLWAALATGGLVGCAQPHTGAEAPPPVAPRPTPATSLEEVVGRDLAAHRATPWTADRRLTWGEFRAVPRRGGPEAAHISYGIYYAWRCRGRAFEFRVVAAMHPRESWVKPEVARDSTESRRALDHEQTHFHITEAYARRMRRHFAALADPCARSDAQLEHDARRLLDEERTTQRRYDAETEHGLRPRQQAEWNAEIRRELGIARQEGA